MDELEVLQDKMHRIKTWVEAYPLDMFPEPDFEKAARVLKENGMTLGAITTSNIRYVLNGIKEIVEADSHHDAADIKSHTTLDGEYYIEYVEADVVRLCRCR